ncbi:MAG TPA: CoA transferase, partial [Chloroflexota bacterium]
RQPVRGPDGNQRGGAEERAGYAHRNKLSITIDLKNPAGQRIGTELAKVADVLVENFSSGAMGRLKLDYDHLGPLNPRLIYVSMSGYGHSGPRRDWTSMNMNLQAYSGLMMTTGSEGDPPTSIANSWNDYIGGLHASFEILEALAERVETGRGKNIDLAQFESSMGTIGPLLLAGAVNHEPPARLGNRSTTNAPQGCYPCAGDDEWCTVSVQTDEQWRGLAQAIAKPSLANDPRFTSAVGRLRHHDEIDAEISAWTRLLPPLEAEHRLKAAGVPADRMRRAEAVVTQPDTGHVYAELETNLGRPTLVAVLPYSFSDSAMAKPEPVPELGAHNRSALQSWLKLSDAEIDTLEAEGALQ